MEHVDFKHGIKGMILSLDMGLGKTLISLAYMWKHRISSHPSLVVVSKTLMYEWKNQIETLFDGSIKILYYHKDFCSPDEVSGMIAKNYDIVITTYDVILKASKVKKIYLESTLIRGDKHSLMKDKVIDIVVRPKIKDNPVISGLHFLFENKWNIIVADESQRFGNRNTKLFRAMMALYALNMKFCLTGTPIRNDGNDLHSQMRWLGLPTQECFMRSFATLGLNKYLIRKTVRSVGMILPPKRIFRIEILLKDKNLDCYIIHLGVLTRAHRDFVFGIVNYACVLEAFLRLRQVCISPYMISKRAGQRVLNDDKKDLGYLKEDFRNWVCDKNGNSGLRSPKIIVVKQILKTIPKGQKVLIFSSFVSCLNLLHSSLQKKTEPDYVTLVTGSICGKKRMLLLEQFKTKKTAKVLLIHYKVGSEGLNIPQANHIICMEPWWNHSTHEQAIARAWRNGQQSAVTVRFIVCKYTIECTIMDLCKYKRNTSRYYIDNGNYAGQRKRISRSELGSLISGANYSIKQNKN